MEAIKVRILEILSIVLEPLIVFILTFLDTGHKLENKTCSNSLHRKS